MSPESRTCRLTKGPLLARTAALEQRVDLLMAEAPSTAAKATVRARTADLSEARRRLDSAEVTPQHFFFVERLLDVAERYVVSLESAA